MEVNAMDIKKAIEYAQVALKKVQEENKINNKQLTAKQLGEPMWLMYYLYDEEQNDLNLYISSHDIDIIEKKNINLGNRRFFKF